MYAPNNLLSGSESTCMTQTVIPCTRFFPMLQVAYYVK